MASLTLLLLGALVVLWFAAALQPSGSLGRFPRGTLSDLWRWDGTVDRGVYATMGLGLFALKHNLDRLLSALVFKRSWSIAQYFFHAPRLPPSASAPQDDAAFYLAMAALALPFVWTGFALTLRRLRSAGLPLALSALFFLPMGNLLFFLLLAALPPAPMPESTRSSSRWLDRLVPEGALGSAAFAVGTTLPLAIAASSFCALFLRSYGWGLFVGVPFCLGLASSLLHGYHAPRSLGSCLSVATTAVGLAGAALLALAVEGVVCLAMAFPLAAALAWMGALVGYFIQRRDAAPTAPALGLLLLGLPALMGMEKAAGGVPALYAVRTAVDIAAPPAAVWRRVVSFSELPPPRHWLFKLGFAYPLKAEIDRPGVGAVRRCVFSTGAFVEPIEVWDEPRLLKFSVTSQPPPMRESSPWGPIQPPHLDHFFVSEGGQFELTPLAGGGTRLEGTTWYRHDLAPSLYWKPWSDFIVHRIHERVLAHIKALAEARG